MPGGLFLGTLLSMPLTQWEAQMGRNDKTSIETIGGKLTLKVFYNPAACNWEEAIRVFCFLQGKNNGAETG
jgi:hypothetical protein